VGVQGVEQLPPAGVGERFEQQVHVVACGHVSIGK
jgi:hypothetical protein